MKKVRIYDLSKELKRDNKDILEICSQLNIDVKSHSSSVTESQAEDIKEAVKKHNFSRPSQNQKSNSNKAPKTKSAPKINNRPKKPEILGVYTTKPSQQDGSEVGNSGSSSSGPVLLTPPRPQQAKPANKSAGHNKAKRELNSPPNRGGGKANSKKSSTSEFKKPSRPQINTGSTSNDKDNKSDSISGLKKPKPKNNKNKNNQRRSKNNQNQQRRPEGKGTTTGDREAKK